MSAADVDHESKQARFSYEESLLSLDQITVSSPIPFRSKWPLVLLLVAAGLVALRRLRTAR